MYTLEEIKEEDRFAGVRIASHGRPVAELRDGITLTIVAMHTDLSRASSSRADDFLHGIALALTHCILTGQVPMTVVS